jgi:hypothetical protein
LKTLTDTCGRASRRGINVPCPVAACINIPIPGEGLLSYTCIKKKRRLTQSQIDDDRIPFEELVEIAVRVWEECVWLSLR